MAMAVCARGAGLAPSGLRGEFRNGQVFLTWKEAPVPEGTTFRVFLHDQPITAETLPQARRVGHHIEAGSACDWWKDPASFDVNATPNRTHGFLIDGEELNARDGLFVHTITEEDPPTMYFAVLPSSSDTVVDLVAVQGAPAFSEPIQLQDAPASNSAVGGSLTLDLHGRGGGTDANNQANFLLFGDTLQGWREGLARKFVVESDDGNIVIKPLDRMWINRPLLYSWDVRDHVPAINTWWYGCNDHIYDPQGVTNGVVVNYTEEHLLYLTRWAQRYFGTDPKRTYIKGTSMGGSGAISTGFHHPDVFASIFSAVPVVAYTCRAGVDGRYNLLRLDGLCGRPCDESVMSSEGIPVMERMDSERIAREYPGDLPFLVLCNGRTDASIPWINNPFFYKELNQSRRGFSCYWNNGAHDMLASVPADVTEFYATQPMELGASYPAFSNFSDNRDPGDGARDDGDIVGWMNRGLHWTDLEETEDSWSLRIHADGDFLTAPLTVDVTPRRLTSFQIAPNETLLVNGQPLQADANGLLTIPDLQLDIGASVPLLVSHSTEIDAVLGQTIDRQEEVLQAQLASPYPSDGLWRHEDFALAAYGLNEQTTTADDELIACATNGLYQASIDDDWFHWHAYLQERIYFLYSSRSDFFPGRMSTNAENAILGMLWDWASSRCDIDMASPDAISWYWGSENHHAQAWVSFWGAAQIFKDHPDYKNRTYADGSTPAQMAAAFDEYFKLYARELATKGLVVEVASPTYAKYILNTWYNLADFAEDPVLKERMGMLLDLYWADWAIEQIDGVRGGSRHRCYPGAYSIERSAAEGSAWFHFGEGRPRSKHPGNMSAATTFWRPSRAVVGLALDSEGRGSYEYVSRRPGIKNSSPPASPPALAGGTYTAMDRDGGHLLRTTWCTPDFVMGMSQVDLLTRDDWSNISSQNHWNGVVFGGHPTARIFTQPDEPPVGSVYNAEWGVQKKGVQILQRLEESNAHGQQVWFDASLARTELGGWVFAEAPGAYAAVRVVGGSSSWQTDTNFPSKGEWLVLADEFSPVIIEVASTNDFADLAAFQSDVMDNALVATASRVDYTSSFHGTTLTLFPDQSALPQVGGVPLDFSPVKVYDSPYIHGDFDSGTIIVEYGDNRTVLGLAPFADDANTVALWHFDEAEQNATTTYYADDVSITTRAVLHAVENAQSSNSISLIADGKFGNAIRCELEAGDQYMMTGASDWPVDQGTFRYQGWIRLNSGDGGGFLFHVYDQVYLSVDATSATFSINKSGVATNTSATNLVTVSANIGTTGEWQYIEAVYDGATIQLITEEATASAPGIGTFVPSIGNIYIGSRKNKSNYVGDMDEVKISAP